MTGPLCICIPRVERLHGIYYGWKEGTSRGSQFVIAIARVVKDAF